MCAKLSADIREAAEMRARFDRKAGSTGSKMNTKQWMLAIAWGIVGAVITLASPVWVGALLFFGPFLLIAGIIGALITLGKHTGLLSAKDLKKLEADINEINSRSALSFWFSNNSDRDVLQNLDREELRRKIEERPFVWR